jgi:hypothetical protein
MASQLRMIKRISLAAFQEFPMKDRVSRNGGRLKKTTIVALARSVLQTHREWSSI